MYQSLLFVFTALCSTLVQANSAEVNNNVQRPTPPTYSTSNRNSGRPQNKLTCEVLKGTNDVRRRRGGYNRNPLKGSEKLDRAAAKICDLMMKYNVLDHSPDGSSPGDRAKQQQYRWSGIAENILYNKGYGGPDPKRAVKQWEDSAGHLRNMVGQYTRHGSAYCTDKDTGRVYFAQEFGKGDESPSDTYECDEPYAAPPSTASAVKPATQRSPTYTQSTPSTQSVRPATQRQTTSYPKSKPSTQSAVKPATQSPVKQYYKPDTPKVQAEVKPVVEAPVENVESASKAPPKRPCVASSYGNKSKGEKLAKRSQSKSSRV